MTCNASDEDEIAIERELRMLEFKLSNVSGLDYSAAMKRKFLHHRIDNLKYMLRNPGVVIT